MIISPKLIVNRDHENIAARNLYKTLILHGPRYTVVDLLLLVGKIVMAVQPFTLRWGIVATGWISQVFTKVRLKRIYVRKTAKLTSSDFDF